jgi:hypothetical protein
LHPATKRFIEVLTEDVNKWEKAASEVDTMLPHLPETDRKHWKELAKEYRTRAERYEPGSDRRHRGQAVAKALPYRTPAEVFLFGAVYIHAAPESYLRFARDFDRFASSPTIWPSGCSAILLSFPT